MKTIDARHDTLNRGAVKGGPNLNKDRSITSRIVRGLHAK